MSHGLLAAGVDTNLASLLIKLIRPIYSLVVQQMRCSVKCTIIQRAEKDVPSGRAVSLR